LIVEEKISRKTQILNIAQQLFREKGFNGTSMRDLATAVGVEPASLYNHFSSKSVILEEICFGLADQFFQAFNEKNACLSPENQLKLAINGHLKVIVQNLNASVVFLHEWRFLEGEKLSKFILLRQEYEKLFSDIIE